MGAGNRHYIPVGSTETIEAVRHVKGTHNASTMGASMATIAGKFNLDGSPATITTVQTADGEKTVNPGDWIVRDKDGIHISSHGHFSLHHIPVN